MKLQLSNGYYLRFDHLSHLLHYVVGKQEVSRFSHNKLSSVLEYYILKYLNSNLRG